MRITERVIQKEAAPPSKKTLKDGQALDPTTVSAVAATREQHPPQGILRFRQGGWRHESGGPNDDSFFGPIRPGFPFLLFGANHSTIYVSQ